ncbi:hypothetical protein L6164_026214 [Bauhinia variegata]|uniref:Uncharacterized protein n=1 Tax=Bauhinia variegata TaxID=167791 RepID=A0ACB9LQZ4_BAUVA|nr:hypothetical protein L6164_026214 [Bauhinia variegata]
MATSPSPAIFLFLWFLCASNFNLGLCTLKVIHCNKNDQQALLVFKQGVVDPTGLLSSWSIHSDCCQWSGVQCDNITGRVTGLSLPCPYYDYYGNYYDKSKCLGGQINLPLFQLEFLESLDLKENDFKGIDLCPTHVNHNLSRPMSPQECEKFSKLLNLDISYNNDLNVGDLLWIFHLPSLKSLYLSGIDLHIQTHWVRLMTELPSISELRLRNCQLGNIHPPLGWYVHSSSLQSLDLSYNFFDSRMFKWVSNLTSLSHLTLEGNHFRGQIPDTVLRLRNLKSLGLAYNEFNGSIPEWLGQYEFLERLDLFVNLFSGPIPTTLGNLSSLIFIDISANLLNGSLPESLGKLSNLEELRVGNNSLVGVISEKNFAKLWSLELIDFSEINIVFDLDSNWAPPIHLKFIHMYGAIMGSIFPSWLYSLGSLHYLNVSSSKISSIDPDKFWSLARRTYAYDVSNNLIGGDLSNVWLNSSWIDLRNNKFKGGLPRLSPKVAILNLANNSFSGSMAPLLCHPMNRRNKLAFLDMSHNQLSGELPDCFANWQSLVYVNLGNNMLTGKIPDSVGSLSALQSFHLPKMNFLELSLRPLKIAET